MVSRFRLAGLLLVAIACRADADVIFGIGCSFTKTNFGVAMPSGKVIIQNSIDSEDLNKDVPVQHVLMGDSKLTLQAVLDEIIEHILLRSSLGRLCIGDLVHRDGCFLQRIMGGDAFSASCRKVDPLIGQFHPAGFEQGCIRCQPVAFKVERNDLHVAEGELITWR